MHRFKDLQIWKLSRKFCSDIYITTSNLLIAFDLGYIEQIKLDELSFTIEQIVKMTAKFKSTLQ